MLESLVIGIAAAALGYVLGWGTRRLIERPRLRFDPKVIKEEGEFWTQYFLKVRNGGLSPSKQTYGLLSIHDLTVRDALDRTLIIHASDVGLTSEKLGMRVAQESFFLAADNFCPVVDELLCWSRYTAPEVVDIPSTGSCNLVLMRHFRSPTIADSRPAQIHIPSEDGWNSLRIALRDDRILELDVRAVNETGQSAKGKVTIKPAEASREHIEIEFEPA